MYANAGHCNRIYGVVLFFYVAGFAGEDWCFDRQELVIISHGTFNDLELP